MVLSPSKAQIVLGANAVAFLDLARAAAANIVLLDHSLAIFDIATNTPAGRLGVGIFFILSGFLIMQSCLARMRRDGPHFGPYMIDRFARIFTAFVPTLILVTAVNAVVNLGEWEPDGLSRGPIAFIGNLLLLQNYPLFQVGLRLTGNTVFYIRSYNTAAPFWTIPIEFWIYVLFGLVFFGLIMRERLGLLPPILLAAVALPVVTWAAATDGLSLAWMIGALAGYVWATVGWRSKNKLQIGLALLLVACVCLVGRGFKYDWNFVDLGLVVCETLILVGAVSALDGIRTLGQPLRRACGFLASYSYSLYLVHNTVLIIVRQKLAGTLGHLAFPFALIMAHVVAFVLYLLFERHYRQVGAWLKRPGVLQPRWLFGR